MKLGAQHQRLGQARIGSPTGQARDKVAHLVIRASRVEAGQTTWALKCRVADVVLRQRVLRVDELAKAVQPDRPMTYATPRSIQQALHLEPADDDAQVTDHGVRVLVDEHAQHLPLVQGGRALQQRREGFNLRDLPHLEVFAQALGDQPKCN